MPVDVAHPGVAIVLAAIGVMAMWRRVTMQVPPDAPLIDLPVALAGLLQHRTPSAP